MKWFLFISTSLLLLTATRPLPTGKSSPVTIPVSDTIPYNALKLTLEKIYDTDQGIREKLGSANGDELGKLIGQMLQIDSVNQAQVKLILKQYNWLPQSKVGEKAADAIFYVVQHADVSLIRTYLPVLKQLALNKEAKTTHAALMEDRLLMYEGKKQIYGTQATSRLRADGKAAIWPIQNPNQVNQLRKEAGFDLTVEENAKRLGAFYNPDEKLPEVKQ